MKENKSKKVKEKNTEIKKESFISKCPLALMIIVSVIIMTIVAVIGIVSGKYANNYGLDHPALEAVLLGNKSDDEKPSETDSTGESKDPIDVQPSTDTTAPVPTIPGIVPTETESTVEINPSESTSENPGQTESTTETENQPTTADPNDPGRINRNMNYDFTEKVEPRSWYYDSLGLVPRNKDYPYEYGDNEYFKDALFIGDSRTQGLYYYGDIDTATYAFLEGVSLYALMKTELEISTGGKGTVEDILKAGDYKKIYIMMGLNELGDRRADEYGQFFADVISRIKALEPGAVITIMGSMPISTAKSDVSEWRNNDNILSRNFWSAYYCCEGTDVFYLDDYIPDIMDEKGGLKESCTNDGIHLMAQYYYLWVNNIRAHCLNAAMWMA